jgi:hypothetical protein
MNWIRTCATNGVTGSEEPENDGSNIFDRPARCLRYRRLGHRHGRRAAGGSTRGLQDRREIHQDIAGRRDNDRAIPEQGYGRLEIQFWVRQQGAFTLLDPEPVIYPAAFLFTNDLKWIIRFQKTGSGESTLYLYRLTPHGTVPASKKPLADLAWAYFKTRPEWRKIAKAPEYHISSGLLEGEKGLEENYRSLGVDWPANRYLLIWLWGEADVKGRKREQTSVVHGWSCRYDLETGKFDVPALFSDDNAKAIVPQ